MTKFNIQHLSFAYGDFPVLKNVAFEVKTNTVNVILGLNGSGKTTLIKLITGVLQAPKGTIFIDGQDATLLSPAELSKKISYVPQNISDDNDFSVRDYLTFGRMNKIKFTQRPRKKIVKKQLLSPKNYKSSTCLTEK